MENKELFFKNVKYLASNRNLKLEDLEKELELEKNYFKKNLNNEDFELNNEIQSKIENYFYLDDNEIFSDSILQLDSVELKTKEYVEKLINSIKSNKIFFETISDEDFINKVSDSIKVFKARGFSSNHFIHSLFNSHEFRLGYSYLFKGISSQLLFVKGKTVYENLCDIPVYELYLLQNSNWYCIASGNQYSKPEFYVTMEKMAAIVHMNAEKYSHIVDNINLNITMDDRLDFLDMEIKLLNEKIIK